MLLDRIDIDTHGPLQRVELGPFSQSINVVNTPEGGGKTALARFLRDALVDREYPLGMLSSSTGRVVFANHYGLIHYYREQDGTARGRRGGRPQPQRRHLRANLQPILGNDRIQAAKVLRA